MKIEKFHIYLADLNPRFGTEPGKIRPVVVIQTNLLNDVHASTIICPMTSHVTKGSKILRVHLTKKQSGIDCESDILVDQIRPINNLLFLKHIGRLTFLDQRRLLENLQIVILE